MWGRVATWRTFQGELSLESGTIPTVSVVRIDRYNYHLSHMSTSPTNIPNLPHTKVHANNVGTLSGCGTAEQYGGEITQRATIGEMVAISLDPSTFGNAQLPTKFGLELRGPCSSAVGPATHTVSTATNAPANAPSTAQVWARCVPDASWRTLSRQCTFWDGQ